MAFVKLETCSHPGDRSQIRSLSVFLLTFLWLSGTACGQRDSSSPRGASNSSGEIRTNAADKAQESLRQLVVAESGWPKIHAAEAAIAIGDVSSVRSAFQARQESPDPVDLRIGIWRVRARIAETPEERQTWIGYIEKAFLDRSSPDRLDAIETLAKLKVALTDECREAARQMAKEESLGNALLAHWALAVSGDNGALEKIVEALHSTAPLARERAAYALRWLRVRSPDVLNALAEITNNEPNDTAAFPYLLSAALILHADPASEGKWLQQLERVLETGSTPARFEACQTLMHFDGVPLSQFAALSNHPDADVRIGAAWAMAFRHSR